MKIKLEIIHEINSLVNTLNGVKVNAYLGGLPKPEFDEVILSFEIRAEDTIFYYLDPFKSLPQLRNRYGILLTTEGLYLSFKNTGNHYFKYEDILSFDFDTSKSQSCSPIIINKNKVGVFMINVEDRILFSRILEEILSNSLISARNTISCLIIDKSDLLAYLLDRYHIRSFIDIKEFESKISSDDKFIKDGKLGVYTSNYLFLNSQTIIHKNDLLRFKINKYEFSEEFKLFENIDFAEKIKRDPFWLQRELKSKSLLRIGVEFGLGYMLSELIKTDNKYNKYSLSLEYKNKWCVEQIALSGFY